MGIDEEKKGRLFKAFSQADSSTTREYGGTGLGLVITQLLAEKMKSRIEFASNPASGSKFYFSIYVDFEICDKPSVHTDCPDILILTENEKYLEVLKKNLSPLNLNIIACKSIDSLLDNSRKRQLCAVLLDNGCLQPHEIDVITQLKSDFQQNHCVLLYSSCDDQQQIELAVKYGATAILRSFLPHSLIQILQRDANITDMQDISENIPRTIINETEQPVQKKILLVEDVAINMLLIKTLIAELFPEVEIAEATTGKDAVDMAINTVFDLIIMDVQMPDIDGITATQMIRNVEAKNSRYTPVVALTACAFQSQREKCLSSGMDDFITKPVKASQLQTLLQKILFGERTN